jgi:hypothetical protein
MDTWKPIRLGVWIGMMLAVLVAGVYARWAWGVAEAPYGVRGLQPVFEPDPDLPGAHNFRWGHPPRRADPFDDLREQLPAANASLYPVDPPDPKKVVRSK